jgi:hypothetical protein
MFIVLFLYCITFDCMLTDHSTGVERRNFVRSGIKSQLLGPLSPKKLNVQSP